MGRAWATGKEAANWMKGWSRFESFGLSPIQIPMGTVHRVPMNTAARTRRKLEARVLQDFEPVADFH